MADCSEDCENFFLQEDPSKKTAKKIDQAFPDCVCEQHSVSEHSPGRVNDGETLVRLIIWPGHVDKNSGIDPKAFSGADSKGLSVNRDDHCSDEQVRTAVEAWVKIRRERLERNPNTSPELLNQWHGVSVCNCETIRRLPGSEGLKAFCVYDTADGTNPYHADIFKTRAMSADPISRRVLWGVFSKLIAARSYREGRVADKLPPDFVSDGAS